jgi:hypothetical protein
MFAAETLERAAGRPQEKHRVGQVSYETETDVVDIVSSRDFRFGLPKRHRYTPAPARPDIFVAGRFRLPACCGDHLVLAYVSLVNG